MTVTIEGLSLTDHGFILYFIINTQKCFSVYPHFVSEFIAL